MFKKKVTVEEFEAFKNEVEAELKKLRNEVKALQRKAGKKLDWSNVKESDVDLGLGDDIKKTPISFFGGILSYLFESSNVFYDDGSFYDESGELIAMRKKGERLRVAVPFITTMFAKHFPPAVRVTKGFYKQAAEDGILYPKDNVKGIAFTSITNDDGVALSALLITDEFLEKYKNGGL